MQIEMKELAGSRVNNSVKDEYKLTKNMLKIVSKFNYYRRLN